MPQTFVLPRQVTHANGEVASSAIARFYKTGTTTPQPVYLDSTLETPALFVQADSAGVLPKVYLDPAAEVDYRVKIETASGVQIYQEDDISRFPVTREEIGAALYRRTQAEIDAGVTPVDLGYAPGDVFRYGARGDGVTDDSLAFEQAALQGAVIVPGGRTYYVGSTSLNVSQMFGGYPRPTVKGTVTGSGSVCRIHNIKFQPDAATTNEDRNTAILYGVDDGSLEVRDCAFDGMSVQVKNDGVLESVLIHGCEFFGTSANNTMNAVAIAAGRSTIISNCLFRGQFYRDIKLTNAPGSAGTELETAFANNNVIIDSCIFKGSRFLDGLGVGKQVIDAFSCARKLTVTNCQFSLSNKVEVWFDFKDAGETSSMTSTLQQEVVFANNVCKGTCERGIRTQGARGQTYAGDRQKMVVSGNVIEATNDDYVSLVEVQYMHDVDVSSNIVIGVNDLQTFIFTGNRRLNFHGNQGNGCALFEEGSRTEAHTADAITAIGNQLVVDSTDFYPMNFSAIAPSASGATISVQGNTFQYIGGTRNVIRFNTLANWDNLICVGNATSDNTKTEQFDGSVPDNIVMENNSWQNVPQTLTGAGAVNLTTYTTLLVTTGSDALTLANGREGQCKRIVMKTDGGTGTLTPTNLYNGTTITFDDVGDSADLLFTDGQWVFMGGTATLA